MSFVAPAVPGPFSDLPGFRFWLEELLRELRWRHDRRGVFTTAYVETTRSLIRHLDAGHFHDASKVRRYILAFGARYRLALEGDQTASAPGCWQLAFSKARDPRTSIAQNLLLGINAHLNHDLPLAILDAGFDPSLPEEEREHQRINAALFAAIPAIRHAVVRNYQPTFWVRNLIVGRVLDRLTAEAFESARTQAWQAARVLAATPALRERLDQRTVAISRQLLAARDHPARCLRLLASAESILPIHVPKSVPPGARPPAAR